MSIWNSIKSFFGYETVTVRAKNAKGRFVADDPNTPDVNEACLLYTSPSPRDQRGARMPSSA